MINRLINDASIKTTIHVRKWYFQTAISKAINLVGGMFAWLRLAEAVRLVESRLCQPAPA